MLLMIDNYDSFTFNLVHYFRALKQDVEVYRNNEISIDDIKHMLPEYIVISPGPCDPNSAGLSLAIVEHFAGVIPILGVCLGHQCIAQYYGATIEKAAKVMHGKTCDIYHGEQGIFQSLNNPLQVTRYHSLIVNKHSLPNELEVTAWSHDENGNKHEIMGLKHKTLAVEGVQFHPESVLTEQGHQLLENFISRYSTK
ncbi:aminodeoxychorismate/anthranilate synthase component II [Colwelliaceae bacterium 6471]